MNVRISLALVALAGLVTTGCAANTEDDARTEGAVSARAVDKKVEPGNFKLYDDPDYEPSPMCDVHTMLVLENDGRGAFAVLRENLVGYCEMYVEPNERTYRLMFVGDDCGSLVYTGSTQKDGKTLDITVTDHRARVCKDMMPSLIVIEESGVTREATKPFVKYSADVAVEPEARAQ